MNDDILKQHLRKLALRKLCPNGYSARGDEITPISDPTPTQAEIDAEVEKQRAEFDAQEYARNRQAEYPSQLELTVALYDTDDKSAVEAKRAAVKLKYPKPE